MTLAKETRIMRWGAGLGIRLPKEFSDFIGLKHRSLIRMEVKNGILQVIPIAAQRIHIPLTERMEKALANGTWDGKPAEITDEDKEWLNMPPVGKELLW